MKTFIVDSFTDRPFQGNPAAVCFVASGLADDVMQKIANELGFSETAFVFDRDSGGRFGIRYFSPKEEIPLCGHATLAAAKAMFETHSQLVQIDFLTSGGETLIVRQANGRLAMEFPAYELAKCDVPAGMPEALGLAQVVDCFFNDETNMIMLVAESEQIVRSLQPDFQRLVETHESVTGVVVTAESQTEDFDFCSRFFWPWSGTNEDPVTGSTHTFMGPFWAEKLGKSTLRSLQCSVRTGVLDVAILGQGDSKQVLITGDAVIMLEGKWRGKL